MDLAKVERVYTSYAKIYDRIFGKVFHEGRQSVIRNLNVQPDEKILEVESEPDWPCRCTHGIAKSSVSIFQKACWTKRNSERQNT